MIVNIHTQILPSKETMEIQETEKTCCIFFGVCKSLEFCINFLTKKQLRERKSLFVLHIFPQINSHHESLCFKIQLKRPSSLRQQKAIFRQLLTF